MYNHLVHRILIKFDGYMLMNIESLNTKEQKIIQSYKKNKNVDFSDASKKKKQLVCVQVHCR